MHKIIILAVVLLCQNLFAVEQAEDDRDDEWENSFNDQPVIPEIVYPDWFKKSTLPDVLFLNQSG